MLPLLFVLLSCHPKGEALNDAHSPLVVRIPWQKRGEKNFKIQDVEIKTIQHLSPLQGSVADLLYNPEIFTDHIDGSPYEVKFTYDSENRIIPLNYLSSEALAIYAHLENLSFWDQTLALPARLHEKMRVGFAARAHGKDGRSVVNNAMYNGRNRSMLIFTYSENGVPVSVNGGVLAHEHFHSIFYDMVIIPWVEQYYNQKKTQKISMLLQKSFKDFESPHVQEHPVNFDQFVETQAPSTERPKLDRWSDKKQRVSEEDKKDIEDAYISTLNRGFNEGIADIWGWFYSQDENFISHSLVEVGNHSRDLNFKSEVLWTEDQVKSHLASHIDVLEDASKYYAYVVGTQVARLLYTRITQVEGGSAFISIEARNKWSQLILNRISHLSDEFAKAGSFTLTPALFVNQLILDQDVLSDSDCQFWYSKFAVDDGYQILRSHCSEQKLKELKDQSDVRGVRDGKDVKDARDERDARDVKDIRDTKNTDRK